MGQNITVGNPKETQFEDIIKGYKQVWDSLLFAESSVTIPRSLSEIQESSSLINYKVPIGNELP